MFLFKFQELNLQSIRRELISVLEDFEESSCLECCNLKGCKCPEPSDNASERTANIPVASAKTIDQESLQESSKGFNYGETLVGRLLRDQEAYPDAAAEQVKLNTAQRIYHSARHKAFKMMNLESMIEMPVLPLAHPHPQMVYTIAPPARALPQPVWVGLNWPRRYVPVMMPGIPGVTVRPVIPAQIWPTNLRTMPNTPTGVPHTPQVQRSPDAPVDAFFRRFQSPGTSGSFETSESPDLSSDQVVPSEGTEMPSR